MKLTIGTNEAGQRVDKFIKKLMKDVPLGAIYKSIRKGDVKLNGKKAKEKDVLSLNDELEIKYLDSKKALSTKQYIQTKTNIKIVYEDKNILLVEKWPGVLVHSSGEEVASLQDYVMSYLNEKGDYRPEEERTFSPSPANRLDRNTSGIVCFGKTFDGLKSLNHIIHEGMLEKKYVALVKGRVTDGLHEAYIKKDNDNNISKIYDEPAVDRIKIMMEVETIESNGAYSFIELNLITGRSHQLRAHLAHLGNPIVGDTKYGNKDINQYFHNKYGLEYQYLYAYKVTFKDTDEFLSYLRGKTIAEKLPPIFRKIKTDVFRLDF